MKPPALAVGYITKNRVIAPPHAHLEIGWLLSQITAVESDSVMMPLVQVIDRSLKGVLIPSGLCYFSTSHHSPHTALISFY
jgi:hypothetical protein